MPLDFGLDLEQLLRRRRPQALDEAASSIPIIGDTLTMAQPIEATCSAPVNIAVIKYWGKRDSKLILPTNSSLSVTLDQDDLRSTTTARLMEAEGKDRLWLNGKEEAIEADSRLGRCLAGMRKVRQELEAKDGSSKDGEVPWSKRAIHIASENNFPTAAGLASSASGFAALAFTLSTLYSLPSTPSELSRIARQGSGSACRSIFGGFVAWEQGTKADGSDSLAVEVAPQSHWPDMEALICVVSDRKKGTSSTSGMQNSVETSPLLQHRIKEVVPNRMKDISTAIKDKDFDTFAKITMADSNQFHAICLDTTPPIFYMNDVSRSIVALVEELNRASLAEGEGYVAAYTYDAGPNAVIYAPKRNMRKVVNLVLRYFPLPADAPFTDPKGLFKDQEGGKMALPLKFNEAVIPSWPAGSVSRLIHTKVGDGPRVLSREVGGGLLNEQGTPK